MLFFSFSFPAGIYQMIDPSVAWPNLKDIKIAEGGTDFEPRIYGLLLQLQSYQMEDFPNIMVTPVEYTYKNKGNHEEITTQAIVIGGFESIHSKELKKVQDAMDKLELGGQPIPKQWRYLSVVDNSNAANPCGSVSVVFQE